MTGQAQRLIDLLGDHKITLSCELSKGKRCLVATDKDSDMYTAFHLSDSDMFTLNDLEEFIDRYLEPSAKSINTSRELEQHKHQGKS